MDTEKSRRRVTRIAAFNGWSVAALGGVCVLTSLWWLSWPGILIGVAAVASGFMELTGRRRLTEGRPAARRWLAGSQVLLLTAILLYAGCQLASFDPHRILLELPPDLLEELKATFGAEQVEQLTGRVHRAIYVALMIASLIYQGGLCLYYALATRKLFSQPPLPPGDPYARASRSP